MALAGLAVLMMWCDYPTAALPLQGAWHSAEHIPERLAVPGFLHGRRGVCLRPEVSRLFMLYELADLSVMVSPDYLARLNAPTPWTTEANAFTSNFNRSPGRVLLSEGLGIGGSMLTIRFSTEATDASGQIDEIRARIEALLQRPEVTSAHLVRTEPDWVRPTKEEAQRGRRDALADLVLILEGYDDRALLEAFDRSDWRWPPASIDPFRLVHWA